ncbi:MAG: histidine--tRNA ligase [bacterium]
MSFKAPRGTQDILPGVTEKWQKLEKIFSDFAKKYGYNEIRTPIFESTDLFQRGVGEETDIVSKQMYSFESRGGEGLTLRPEGTAPTVRAVIQNNLISQGGITKLYYMGPIFRYERPQKGRYRQFHQVGAEAFGSTGPLIDAELLEFASNFLNELGIRYKLELNSVGCSECRPVYRANLRDFLKSKLPELCDDCARRYETNPLRILDCKVESCINSVKDAPYITESLCNDCSEHFIGLKQYLSVLKVPYVLNPKIVRGLDYYTKTAFEFIAEGLGSQSTVLAGGRYDGLVKELGGQSVPAIGFAAGIERLIDSSSEKSLEIENNKIIYFAAIGENAKLIALPTIQKLRLNGIRVEYNYENKSLKAQLRDANRFNAYKVVIIGDNEINDGVAVIRNMIDSTQEAVALNEIFINITK